MIGVWPPSHKLGLRARCLVAPLHTGRIVSTSEQSYELHAIRKRTHYRDG